MYVGGGLEMGSLQLRSFYNDVLCGAFPLLRCAFAYGSSVFRQHQQPKGKMLDLIFVVDDAESWHSENLARNPHHYSFLRYLGTDVITKTQRAGGRVYYNTLVEIDSQVVKYGVICMEDLLDDLKRWRWLYISGRLHKPVVFLTDTNEDSSLHDALEYNLSLAACCAVLLLDNSNVPFTTLELFSAVAALSYRGDFRMLIGEDKKKVHNIVKGSITEFQHLYAPYLSNLVDILPDKRMIKKDSVTIQSCQGHFPEAIKQRILRGESLISALASVVRRSSINQSLKGILTAGPSKTVEYSYRKLVKMIESMRYH